MNAPDSATRRAAATGRSPAGRQGGDFPGTPEKTRLPPIPPKPAPQPQPNRPPADRCLMPRLTALCRSPTAVFFILLWLGLLALAPGTMLGDPGTLWHTVVGERILETGRLPRVDEFSFTAAGQPWIAQQWVGEIAMALLYRMGGLDTLVLASVTLLAAVYASLFGRFLRAGAPWPAAAVLVMLAIAAGSYHFLPRPHLATIAFLAVLLILLTDVEAGRRDHRWLLAVPPLFVVWTNTHGGALGGLATLLAVALGWLVLGPSCRSLSRLWSSRRRGTPRPMPIEAISPGDPAELPSPPAAVGKPPSALLIGLAAGLSLVGVLVNPYGPSLPRVWVSLMNSPVLPKLIIEHAPLRLLSAEGLVVLTLAGVYLLLLLDAGRRGLRVTWLVPLLWLAMSLSRIRHGPLFAVSAAVVVAEMLPHSVVFAACRRRLQPEPSGPAVRPRPPTRFAPGWIAAAGLVALAVVLQAAGTRCPVLGAGWSALSPAQWPIRAVAALRANLPPRDRPARVFNHLGYGGYLIFAAPETRVYIDDRCELYRDDGMLRYARLAADPRAVDALAVYDGIDFALVRAGSSFDRHFSRGGWWRLLHRDETAALFARLPAAVAGR